MPMRIGVRLPRGVGIPGAGAISRLRFIHGVGDLARTRCRTESARDPHRWRDDRGTGAKHDEAGRVTILGLTVGLRAAILRRQM
jgi:hypothetical protein